MKYVCELCGSIYDEALGDPAHGIPAGTAFADLPHYFGCTCGSEKEAFSPMRQDGKLARNNREDKAFWGYTKYSDSQGQSDR